MITPRTWTDYDPTSRRSSASFPGARTCTLLAVRLVTKPATMYAINTESIPRYWIYLTNLGLQGELLRDKDIICSASRATSARTSARRDVRPEGVMKALQHWLESRGTRRSHARPSSTRSSPASASSAGASRDSEVLFNS